MAGDTTPQLRTNGRQSRWRTFFRASLGSLSGISYTIQNETEPSCTHPQHEIVKRTAQVCEKVLGMETVATVRVGASDAPHFRARGIPSVTCGLTPFNMGAPDEHVLIEELCALGEIYALAAYDYLAASAGETNDGRNL